MEKTKLLIVDDDETIRGQMRWALTDEYDINLAEDGETAIRFFKQEKPCLVTLDLGLPPAPHNASEGLKTLSEILGLAPETKVIVITGNTEKANALKAIEAGAYDFFTKPVDLTELKILLRRASHLYKIEDENRKLQKMIAGQPFEEIIGQSQPMQAIFSAIRKVAPTDAPVLIIGESGTGKELIARAIHRQSTRREAHFVTINCGAIPENLLESELFGHEKGSFTGAHIQRKGKIESAQGGTLFLDEIGELHLPLQVKLLRFLQEHKLEHIGGREEIIVDARVIAATNVDLKKAIAEGRFREDLYYRLGVVTISLPPLRDREGDILLLASFLLQKYSAENKKKIPGFTRQATIAIQSYNWPGNIRELENRIKRAVIMTEGQRLTPEDLELASPHKKYEGLGLKEAREALEKDIIQKALAKNRGNISQTAAELGITRPTLYELMVKLEIGNQGVGKK